MKIFLIIVIYVTIIRVTETICNTVIKVNKERGNKNDNRGE